MALNLGKKGTTTDDGNGVKKAEAQKGGTGHKQSVAATKEALKDPRWDDLQSSIRDMKAKKPPQKKAEENNDKKKNTSWVSETAFYAFRPCDEDGSEADPPLVQPYATTVIASPVRASASSFDIKGFCDIHLQDVIHDERGRRIRPLILKNVAYVADFHTNLVSEAKLKQGGVSTCAVDDSIRVGTSIEDSQVVGNFMRKDSLWVLQYKPVARYVLLPESRAFVFSAFQTGDAQPRQKARRISSDPRPPRADSAEI
ncbi:uncharacterized protein B0I36DRAFT_355917 [Microdochium trichocladiopsis]|uniref:Uncharacterized protein n=1 Tax=Microdochium trichocladiopsis TaxID=1682393 RepID=A0A9P9BFQ1_9PEZI|nr:uncharacterized protein B0I36DRAFT_355917 [Microdochium trichocladiopsis]KAH7012516.1 hypothetical protein B0I36DRAFT_355917 [Microdochium trichocladiopsis]